MSLERKQMLETLPQVGEVQWIGLRPERRAPINVVQEVEANEHGLEGDFFVAKSAWAKRQVTLIQAEHITAMASILGRNELPPELMRRNIVVAKINLQSLKDRHFQIGDAILYGTGNCAPCSLMEKNLGPGGYNAMRGHGGITARVTQHGTIRVGDAVCIAPQ